MQEEIIGGINTYSKSIPFTLQNLKRYGNRQIKVVVLINAHKIKSNVSFTPSMLRYCGKAIGTEKASWYINRIRMDTLGNRIYVALWIWDLNWLEFKIE